MLEPCKVLERQGYEVTYLQPDRAGNISLDDLEAALRPDTVLVSMMLVNNELGTVLPWPRRPGWSIRRRRHLSTATRSRAF